MLFLAIVMHENYGILLKRSHPSEYSLVLEEFHLLGTFIYVIHHAFSREFFVTVITNFSLQTRLIATVLSYFYAFFTILVMGRKGKGSNLAGTDRAYLWLSSRPNSATPPSSSDGS